MSNKKIIKNTILEFYKSIENSNEAAFRDLVHTEMRTVNIGNNNEIFIFNVDQIIEFTIKGLKSAKEIINKGKRCAKLDAKGPEPPLQMPAWQAALPDRDIDAIIIYFI